MKNFFYLMSVAFIAVSCSNSTGTSDPADEKEKITTITDTWVLVPDASKIEWNREVDNKLVKKKVKMFGAYMDVTMENVQFSTSGDFIPDTGSMICVNNEWKSGEVALNITAMKLYSDNDEEFFTTKEFPGSKLTINEITPDSADAFTLNCTLTIPDSSKTLDIPVRIFGDAGGYQKMEGEFIIQTLDWPLKDKPDRANVRKDEISLKFSLAFEKQASDTVITEK